METTTNTYKYVCKVCGVHLRVGVDNCLNCALSEPVDSPAPRIEVEATAPLLEWVSDLPGTEFEDIGGMLLRRDHQRREDKITVYAIGVTCETGKEWCTAVNSHQAMRDCLAGVLDQLEMWGSGDGPLADDVRAALKLAGE